MANLNNLTVADVNFVGSATSAEVALDGRCSMGIIVPASFTATSITFTCSLTSGGTFYTLNNDGGSPITVTVSGSNAGWYDLTSIFPASAGFIKLVASTSITNTVQLVQRSVS